MFLSYLEHMRPIKICIDFPFRRIVGVLKKYTNRNASKGDRLKTYFLRRVVILTTLELLVMA
jgi:hypothetical protein